MMQPEEIIIVIITFFAFLFTVRHIKNVLTTGEPGSSCPNCPVWAGHRVKRGERFKSSGPGLTPDNT